ncbi:hypothetical protein [Ruminococcus flavefaciens]|uniref:Uncharacterized protein n=1 Tax=Ruminococcus flavefaciens TaxID=1265 RepID=A0A1M7MET6_RUMFL|nr:hypothetical protein [Ruminococcus flavefaciens]SHM89362.1 hypothetical protein SAMN04487860_1223 [Ruminococcus flavefaciens]
MKKMRINDAPVLIQVISLGLFFIIPVVCMRKWGDAGELIGFIVGGAIMIWLLTRGTIVEFGKGTVIRCRYAFYMWKIDLKKIDRFSYSIDELIARGGPRSVFTLRFYYKVDDYDEKYVFRKIIDKNDIINFMSGNMEQIELMEIYRYAESVYPEKAEGYVEDRGFFE